MQLRAVEQTLRACGSLRRASLPVSALLRFTRRRRWRRSRRTLICWSICFASCRRRHALNLLVRCYLETATCCPQRSTTRPRSQSLVPLAQSSHRHRSLLPLYRNLFCLCYPRPMSRRVPTSWLRRLQLKYVSRHLLLYVCGFGRLFA